MAGESPIVIAIRVSAPFILFITFTSLIAGIFMLGENEYSKRLCGLRHIYTYIPRLCLQDSH